MPNLNANTWLLLRYSDPTCGGDGIVNVNLVKQQCPDCKGSGLDEARIALDTTAGIIPRWVLDNRTI